jgi:hypothetical protein
MEPPILDGPPGFVVLALIVALAAYLRAVSTGADELITKIKSEKLDLFPYDGKKTLEEQQDHTRAKLRLLDNTRVYVAKVTPAMFFLMVFVAFRIFLYALSRVDQDQLPHFGLGLRSFFLSSGFLRGFDLGLCIAILGLIIALFLLHRAARSNDDDVRTKLTDWEAKKRAVADSQNARQ